MTDNAIIGHKLSFIKTSISVGTLLQVELRTNIHLKFL